MHLSLSCYPRLSLRCCWWFNPQPLPPPQLLWGGRGQGLQRWIIQYTMRNVIKNSQLIGFFHDKARSPHTLVRASHGHRPAPQESKHIAHTFPLLWAFSELIILNLIWICRCGRTARKAALCVYKESPWGRAERNFRFKNYAGDWSDLVRFWLHIMS